MRTDQMIWSDELSVILGYDLPEMRGPALIEKLAHGDALLTALRESVDA